MTFAPTLVGFAMAVTGLVPADDPETSPRPIPLTRPEMKQLLEDMKSRKPRIPLPELTADEKAKIAERTATHRTGTDRKVNPS